MTVFPVWPTCLAYGTQPESTIARVAPLAAPLPAGFALEGIDVNVVPAEGRCKRMLIADMDSTIIGVECIDELADFAGLKPEVAAITDGRLERLDLASGE